MQGERELIRCLTLHQQEAEPEPNFGLSGKLAAESNKVTLTAAGPAQGADARLLQSTCPFTWPWAQPICSNK
jgi:hypothetical protein